MLTSSPFKVLADPAAAHAGIATLTSSLRPQYYIFPTLATDLLGCISAYKEKMANKQTRNKSLNRHVDMLHGQSPPPLDCDLKVVIPMPRPFELDCIQSQERQRKKERKHN